MFIAIDYVFSFLGSSWKSPAESLKTHAFDKPWASKLNPKGWWVELYTCMMSWNLISSYGIWMGYSCDNNGWNIMEDVVRWVKVDVIRCRRIQHSPSPGISGFFNRCSEEPMDAFPATGRCCDWDISSAGMMRTICNLSGMMPTQKLGFNQWGWNMNWLVLCILGVIS